MKKSVLSIVAIAFAAVSVLSSCDKNDDGYGQSAKPAVQSTTSTSSSTGAGSSTSSSVEKTSNFKGKCFFIDDELASLGNFKIQVSDGTKTAEYDLTAQGEHCTKTFKVQGQDKEKSMSVTGYYLEVVLPAKGNLDFKVTFTPNDKAKSLTANDKFNAMWVVASGESDSSTIKFDTTLNINQGVIGDEVLTYCKILTSHMSM